jgi:hypothetical protein
MSKRFCKSVLGLLAAVLFGVAAKQFCYKKTDGFALYKILSSLAFHEEWVPATEPVVGREELSGIFNQPFRYLAKGAQSYVFASADSQTVIKFFRLYHLRPPLWMSAISMPPALQPFKVGKMIEKRRELSKDFLSYKLAFEEMREETGLIYLHLNKTAHLNRRLKIYDKIGIAYELDLDGMEFLVQKRATLVYPCIEALMGAGGVDAAKGAISSLVNLLHLRCEKGIFDKDPDLNTNFGFLGGTAIQIDIGRFDRRMSPVASAEEILRITDNFRQWLDGKYPALAEHLMAEIEKISV